MSKELFQSIKIGIRDGVLWGVMLSSIVVPIVWMVFSSD